MRSSAAAHSWKHYSDETTSKLKIQSMKAEKKSRTTPKLRNNKSSKVQRFQFSSSHLKEKPNELLSGEKNYR